MALIFEVFADSADGKKIPIPKKASEVLGVYKDGIEAQLGKGQNLAMFPGGRMLKKLSNDSYYNEKGGNKRKNGSKSQGTQAITPNDAQVFLTRQKKSLNAKGVNSPNNFIYAGQPGKIMKDFAELVVDTGRRVGKQVQPVKPVKPNAAADTKPSSNVKAKEISMPNGNIKYQIAASRKIDMGNKKIYLSETQLIKLKKNK